jgi:hypothetical protein
MAREELQAASNALRRAAEQVGDDELEDRIYSQSNQMAKLAARDRGPDHGRLDRHMHTLGKLAEETDDEVSADVREALEQVRAYRETVEGV